MNDVTLTPAECRALYELIAELSGCNPEHAFAPEEEAADATDTALARVFTAAGRGDLVPAWLREGTR